MNKIIGIILICLCIVIHFLITRHYDKEKESTKSQCDNETIGKLQNNSEIKEENDYSKNNDQKEE